MSLCVKRLTHDAILPTRGSNDAAGYDLYSTDQIIIPPTHRALVGTSIAILMPDGVYGRVAPRSGLAVKHGIQVGAGVIDSDYTGEVRVVLFNHGDRDFEVKKGDRIAQLILEKCETPDVQEIGVLKETDRGAGGFGSTGGFFLSRDA
jgi:dUTP pyrophosphatase